MLRIFRLTARRLVISERCSRFRAQLRRLALLPRPVDPERKNAVRLFDFPWGAPNPSFTIAMRRVFISLNIQRHARKSLLHSRPWKFVLRSRSEMTAESCERNKSPVQIGLCYD